MGMEERNGTEFDEQNIKSLFEKLHFEVTVLRNRYDQVRFTTLKFINFNIGCQIYTVEFFLLIYFKFKNCFFFG